MNYNINERDLWKSKMIQRAGYKKGVFITDVAKLAHIIQNGGQVEVRAQEVREIKGQQVQVLEVRIYFVAPPDPEN